MKAGEIEIYKNILCTLDAALPMTNVTEIKLDTEDALYGYIAKLCAAALSDTGARTATYGAEDYAALLVPTEPEGMEAFAEEVSGRIYELIRDNAEMKPGCGIFSFFMADEQAYTAFFKLPFLEMYQCRLDAEGNVSWALNSKMMPKSGLKNCEYFVIDGTNRTVRLSDTEHYIGDVRVNYLADEVLRLRAKKSEKKTVEVMREAAVEVIRECYPKEQVAEKIMDYNGAGAARAHPGEPEDGEGSYEEGEDRDRQRHRAAGAGCVFEKSGLRRVRAGRGRQDYDFAQGHPHDRSLIGDEFRGDL